MSSVISRRNFLGGAAALGATAAWDLMTPGLARAASVNPKGVHKLDDIEHFVILMQENRPFDQYFGTMSDVIGFSDPNALPGVFYQKAAPFGQGTSNIPDGYLLPWRMETAKSSAQSLPNCDHEWSIQHLMYNNGHMDQFLLGQTNNIYTMGYFNRYDIPYHFALADAFTICDAYHCSVLGPTEPNRLMLMTGTIDPQGLNGGPMFENFVYFKNQLSWKTFPEVLQEAGVNWMVYQETDNYSDNLLPYFTAFADTTTDLYRRGNSFLPTPGISGSGIAAQLKHDVLNGTLPEVTWIVGPGATTEHPPNTPGRAAQFIDDILNSLTADIATWEKTLFIINFDENDGNFDHVVPPTPPLFTEGEYLGNLGLGVGPALGPIGLGFRVPCFMISPLTRGPMVCSDLFDHTSVIKLLERRFNVHCPNISDWRRETTGDMTSAINFAGPMNTTVPKMPDAAWLAELAEAESRYAMPGVPMPQSMPVQETLPVRSRPSGAIYG